MKDRSVSVLRRARFIESSAWLRSELRAEPECRTIIEEVKTGCQVQGAQKVFGNVTQACRIVLGKPKLNWS